MGDWIPTFQGRRESWMSGSEGTGSWELGLLNLGEEEAGVQTAGSGERRASEAQVLESGEGGSGA